MQLQTSIRSCEGNHYVVTVINDAAENSGLLSNNPCAQGAFEGRGPVAKETDDIQNGPRSTVLLSFSVFLPAPTDFFFFLPHFFPFVSKPAAARPLKIWETLKSLSCEAFGNCCFIFICVYIDFTKKLASFRRYLSEGCCFLALMPLIYFFFFIPPSS